MKIRTKIGPLSTHARTHVCLCILSIVPIALLAQNGTRPVPLQSQMTNIRVGAVSIAIPSPTNDLVEPGPDYRVIFEPLAPANNRLVAAFIPADKMDAVHKGNSPSMDEYALVEIGRRMEFTEIDSATFQQIAAVLAKQFGGDINQPSKNGQDEIDRNLKALGNSSNGKMDKPLPLGIFFSKTNAIGVGSITPYNANGVTTTVAGCLALLRIRGRILSVFTYAGYKDEASVQWVKTTAEQWADAILNANEGPNAPSQ